METKGFPSLLNVRQVAERLAIRESTVRAWLLRRKLPQVHIGSAVRVPADAVEKYIREHTTPAREVRR